MVNLVGGNTFEFGNFYKLLYFHVYDMFYHRISVDSLSMYTDLIDMYRCAIWERLKSLPILEELRHDSDIIGNRFRLVWIPFEDFRVFGLLDCTDIRIFRQQDDPNNPLSGEDLQSSFYSRYFRSHDLKFQIVVLPDNMIGRIFDALYVKKTMVY